MITPDQLAQSTIWKAAFKEIHFEIVHWGVKCESNFEPMNNGKGCWNYYVFLLERRLENFSDFWLEPEVKEFSIGGTKFVSYDYYKSPLAADLDCTLAFEVFVESLPESYATVPVNVCER